MLFMIERKNQVLIEILEILLKKNDWVVTKDIALQTNLSLRSVNNYLKLMKEKYPSLVLESSRAFGYRAVNLSSDNFKKIQRKIFNESLSVKIITTVFFSPSITIDDCMNLFKISRTTMYRRIEEINNKLNRYDVEIQLQNNKCRLVSSDEIKLRLIISIFFIESDDYKEETFFYYQRIIKERLTDVFSDTTDLTNFYKKDFYILYYYVSIIRENQSFHFQDSLILKSKDNECVLKEEILLSIDSSIKYIESYKHVRKIKNVNDLFEKLEELISSTLSSFSINSDKNTIRNLVRMLLDIYLLDIYIGINDLIIFRMFHFFTDPFNKEYPRLYKITQTKFEEFLEKTGINLLNIVDYSVAAAILSIPELMECA